MKSVKKARLLLLLLLLMVFILRDHLAYYLIIFEPETPQNDGLERNVVMTEEMVVLQILGKKRAGAVYVYSSNREKFLCAHIQNS
jgi:hypothetical protein